MPTPEVWGPTTWTLFHVLIEKLQEDAYDTISPQLFQMIIRICKNLPCPECSKDASGFLGKIKMSDLKNKTDLKNAFYIFHNYVNAKKRKPLFNYSNIDVYKKPNILQTINRFIQNYHTKGNMQLINDSFQRNLVIKDFKSFIQTNILSFVQKQKVPLPLSNTIQPKQDDENNTL